MSNRQSDRHDTCCGELPRLSRRELLAGSSKLALFLSSTAALPRLAFSSGAGGERDFMLVIFLRGGMDGLTTCVPYGDPGLYAARPTLAIPPPGGGGTALDLDGFFGLAPAAAPLLTPWGNGHLAIVHAAGSTDPTRSHFDAMRFMERGVPEQPGSLVTTGWLARHLESVATGGGLLRGMVLEDLMTQTLAGAPATLPIDEPDDFDFPGSPATAGTRRHVVQQMYAAAGGAIAEAGANTLATIDMLESVDFDGYVPENGADYPPTLFGQKLRNLSALLKAEVGLECAQADTGGWDLHQGLGPLNGTMAGLLDQLTRALEAFYLDNLAGIDRLVVVVLSEFGRRVGENGSAGVDHGHGNAMLVMGGHVAGGTVLTQWPGLAPGQLDNGDLAITTDYRDVLSEILALRMENQDLDAVFPNHVPSFPGITV